MSPNMRGLGIAAFVSTILIVVPLLGTGYWAKDEKVVGDTTTPIPPPFDPAHNNGALCESVAECTNPEADCADSARTLDGYGQKRCVLARGGPCNSDAECVSQTGTGLNRCRNEIGGTSYTGTEATDGSSAQHCRAITPITLGDDDNPYDMSNNDRWCDTSAGSGYALSSGASKVCYCTDRPSQLCAADGGQAS